MGKHQDMSDILLPGSSNPSFKKNVCAGVKTVPAAFCEIKLDCSSGKPQISPFFFIIKLFHVHNCSFVVALSQVNELRIINITFHCIFF